MERLYWFRWGLNFFECLACITGFIYWHKLRTSHWKWFPIYLATILITELTGKYIQNVSLNLNLYKFFGLPVQFLFFFWLFAREADRKGFKRLVYWGTFIYVASWLTDVFYLSTLKFWFSSFSYTIGNIILVLIICRFFFNFINTDAIINYKSSMIFWVTAGLIIFYLGTLPFFGLRNILYYNYRNIFWIYNYIQYVLDCFMYLFFSIAFVWGKPK